MSSPPELTGAQRVLAVQPHYDDNDIGAGGTLAALADAGAEIVYLTVSDDLVGVLDADLSDADARARLRAEQDRAGALIGVSEHEWLDLPDAGAWDEIALRDAIIDRIRRLRPDWLFSVDPWLRHEAHPDHLRTGHAVAQAALFHGLPRLQTPAAPPSTQGPHPLVGVAFYFTGEPNHVFDVSATRARKDAAIATYQAQFGPADLTRLRRRVEAGERQAAAPYGFSHGEPLKLLRPRELHCHVPAE